MQEPKEKETDNLHVYWSDLVVGKKIRPTKTDTGSSNNGICWGNEDQPYPALKRRTNTKQYITPVTNDNKMEKNDNKMEKFNTEKSTYFFVDKKYKLSLLMEKMKMEKDTFVNLNCNFHGAASKEVLRETFGEELDSDMIDKWRFEIVPYRTINSSEDTNQTTVVIKTKTEDGNAVTPDLYSAGVLTTQEGAKIKKGNIEELDNEDIHFGILDGLHRMIFLKTKTTGEDKTFMKDREVDVRFHIFAIATTYDSTSVIFETEHLQYLRNLSSDIADFQNAVIPKGIFDHMDEVNLNNNNKSNEMKKEIVRHSITGEHDITNQKKMIAAINKITKKYWSDSTVKEWMEKWTHTLNQLLPIQEGSQTTIQVNNKQANQKLYTKTNKSRAGDNIGGAFMMLEYTRLCILLPSAWAQRMTGLLKSVAQIIPETSEQLRLLSE
jgi:hypothetical protein